MPILNRLVDIYERRGFRVASGLNADAFGGFWLAPFTWLFDGDGVYARGSGIALQEVYFLECLFEDYRPKTLFVIGNACGSGTLALALLNPRPRSSPSTTAPTAMRSKASSSPIGSRGKRA